MAKPRKLDWLDNQHDVYKARVDEWERFEARLRGGTDVLAELWPFEWESTDGATTQPTIGGLPAGAARDVRTKDVVNALGQKIGEHYTLRQHSATYINFPDMYGIAMVGHILRAKPEVDYGTLGEVDRSEGQLEPSRAELFHYNADGVGNDGSQFWNFVRDVAKRAAAGTGHRWVFVEAPAERPRNGLDEIRGLRPYVVEWSPVQVPDWHYDFGRLSYAIVRVPIRQPRVERGKMVGAGTGLGYYLLVRQGWTGFDGEEENAGIRGAFSAGGWFLFDADKNYVAQGNWQRTGGEIPMAVCYYERDKGSKAGGPAMSRSGAAELGNCAVSYMNLSSAADFDAWDAMGSLQIVRGATPEAFNTMVEKIREGNRWAPLPANQPSGDIPDIYDASTGAVAADVADRRLQAKREEARELAALEATSVPDSSGVSKQAGFSETKVPRLSLMASEIEQCFNAVLRWVELRWGTASPGTPDAPAGNAPRAVVRMPREFDLRDVMADLERYFTIRSLAGVSSETVDAKAMTMVAVRAGAISDNETDTAEGEFRTSVREAAQAKAQQSSLLTEFGGE